LIIETIAASFSSSSISSWVSLLQPKLFKVEQQHFHHHRFHHHRNHHG
ncbi:unnamed protein product, partial [Rotaria magnacalcarata]